MARKSIMKLPIGIDEREQIRNIKYDISLGFVPGAAPPANAPVQPIGPRGIVFNNFPRVLPTTSVGATYYEYQIGQARPNDPRPRGKIRLVALVQGGLARRLFLTTEHYERGSFIEIE